MAAYQGEQRQEPSTLMWSARVGPCHPIAMPSQLWQAGIGSSTVNTRAMQRNTFFLVPAQFKTIVKTKGLVSGIFTVCMTTVPRGKELVIVLHLKAVSTSYFPCTTHAETARCLYNFYTVVYVFKGMFCATVSGDQNKNEVFLLFFFCDTGLIFKCASGASSFLQPLFRFCGGGLAGLDETLLSKGYFGCCLPGAL